MTTLTGENLPKPNQPAVDQADLDAIVGGYHGAPYHILGPHLVTIADQACLAVRTFRPLDKQVFVLDIQDGQRCA